MSNLLSRAMSDLYRLIHIGVRSKVGQSHSKRSQFVLSYSGVGEKLTTASSSPRQNCSLAESGECGRCRFRAGWTSRVCAVAHLTFAIYAHSWQSRPWLVATSLLGVASSSRGPPYRYPASPHLSVLSDTVWIFRYSSSSWRCISKST